MVEVPLQQFFKGSRQVLPSNVASTPCSELGVTGLQEKMNFHLNTSYALNPERRSLLETCLKYANDFGVASVKIFFASSSSSSFLDSISSLCISFSVSAVVT